MYSLPTTIKCHECTECTHCPQPSSVMSLLTTNNPHSARVLWFQSLSSNNQIIHAKLSKTLYYKMFVMAERMLKIMKGHSLLMVLIGSQKPQLSKVLNLGTDWIVKSWLAYRAESLITTLHSVKQAIIVTADACHRCNRHRHVCNVYHLYTLKNHFTLQDGQRSLIFAASPETVPPVPAPHTTMSNLPVHVIYLTFNNNVWSNYTFLTHH